MLLFPTTMNLVTKEAYKGRKEEEDNDDDDERETRGRKERKEKKEKGEGKKTSSQDISSMPADPNRQISLSGSSRSLRKEVRKE